MLTLLIRLRSWARALGLTRLIRRGQNLSARQALYEARFSKAMVSAISEGQCVWDIGANLGYYTEKFATRVGAQGRVVAFEPTPACFAELRKRFSAAPNVVLVNEAIGDALGEVSMALESNALGATHRIVASHGGADAHNTISVPLTTAAEFIRRYPELVPNVAKIDVEGFEEEVLRGFEDYLGSPRLRMLFVEVHFALLEERGKPYAPASIVKTLEQSGLKVTWTDSSHIIAVRNV